MKDNRERFRKKYAQPEEDKTDFVCSWGRYRGTKLSEITDLRFLKVYKKFIQPVWKIELIAKRIEELEDER